MKNCKKFLAMFSVMFVMFFGIVLSGCENDNNMTLSLSKTNIEITLGENESDTATLEALVENARTKDVSISYDSSDISISSKSEGNGVTLITVKALRQCKNVEVLVKGVKQSKTFYVSVYEPISSISSKQEYFSMEYDFEKGGSFSLSSDLVNILPNGTNQTGLKYSLPLEIPGVSIENNVLKIESGLTNVPETIDIKVTSIYKEEVSTQITFKVVKSIDISQITIEEDNNVLAKNSYNIPRNNTNKNTLLLKVVVPFSVTSEQLDVKEMYAYGDIGLKVNESSVQKTDKSYVYSFLFGFSSQSTSLTMVDKIWFNLSYKDYPTISQSTQNMTGEDNNGVITITAYDEVTDIGCYVNDTKLSTSKVNLYTSYNNTFGLKARFETLPTNALNSNLVIHIAQSDADYVLIKNEKGETLIGKYENSEKTIEFSSGTNFYLVANKSKFEKDKEIKLTITNQDTTQSNVIKKEITLVLKEGIDNYGFGTSADALEKTQSLYLENKVGTNDLTQNTITFGVSPATTYIDNLKLEIYGDVFEVVSNPIKDETISDNQTSFYRLTIKAKQEVTGDGTLTLKFETGQELVANITVIERFENVNVNVDLATFASSSVGKIEQDGDNLTYVAIKNNKIIPLKYSSSVKISKVEYAFQDCLYSDYNAQDVYDENSDYVKFNSTYDANSMVDTSAVIDADTLKTNKYINTLALGKVWVRFSFFGYRLNQDFELEEFSIEKFVLFEVYNPVEYLNISDKVISVYAYSEVGEVNKSKTMATFTVDINENATYNKILFGLVDGRPDMAVELDKNEISIYSESDSQLLYTISKVEGSNNKYTVKANVRTSENIKYLYIFVKDILDNEISLEKTITFVTNKANLVDKITVTNVDEVNGEQTIYLNSTFLSIEYSENNFKILTTVTAVDTSIDALCSEVAYIFYPAGGTSSNIISISNEGVVSVTGEYGGKGIIRVIPRDAILRNADGTTYYRENMPYVDINIVVLDGQTKETAKRVYSASDFTNENLHYMLMNDISISSEIFSEFSGGLYGQNIGSSTIWTINTTKTLFGKISNGAIIEDVLICCTVADGNGAVANENYGTLQNVTVDIYTDGTNSTIRSDANYVGGLVGENYGTIKNSSFSGSVFGNTSSSTVGAIAGKNSGTIESSRAIFYAIENQDMKILGKISGGLVGEMTDSGKLGLSYAYSFANSDVGVSAGIVGKVSSQSVRVEKCFAELGKVENIYGELDSQVTNVNAVIKDCYTTSNYENADKETVYRFNYIMTQRNNKTISGTYLSTDGIKTYTNVSFGYGDVWANGENSNINYGFPYLNEVTKISAISSEELENISVQKTSISLASENDYAILMLTKVNQSLTSKEYSQIAQLNIVNYLDLFGITNSNGLVVKSDNSEVISCQNNYLKIVNLGECKLTVSSKYDSSIAPKVFNIKVLNLINNFRLLYGNTEIADGVTVGIKKNSTQTLKSVVKTQISLGERVVSVVLDDLKVKFITENGENCKEVVGEKVGSHYVNLTTDDNKVLSVYLYLDTLNSNYQKVLENNTKRTITLKPYKGASAVISSIENASISATDTLGLQISISSDASDETLACDIFDENGVKVFDSNGNSFDGKTNKNLVSGSLININILSTTNNTYKLQVELNKSKLKQITSSFYTLRFYAQNNNSDIYSDVKLVVLDQEIERIDVYTYSYKEKDKGGEVYSFYPTNTIINNEPSLIDLMIYPSYANFAYITVTSDVVNGERLSLLSLRKGSADNESSSAYYTDYLTNSEALKDGNGIKIINKGDQQSEVARFYIRALATTSVTKDTVFNLTIKIYNSNDEVILTQIHSVLVSPPQKAGLSIEGKELYNNKYYALVGEKLTVKMVVERDQWIDDYSIINDAGSGVVVGVLTYNNDFENIDAKYKKCTFTLDLNSECYDDFTIQVNTKRKINGKEETISSTQKVYIVPFELDMSKTEVSGSAYRNVALGDIYFKRTLNFNLGANYTEAGEVDYTKFIATNYFYNDHNFSVNVDNVLYKNNAQALRNNLYYVNTVDGKVVYTSIYNNTQNGYVKNDITNIVEFSEENGEIHFIGNNVGEQKMRLVLKVVLPDGTETSYNFDFTIQIKAELNDDEPQQIYTAQEFLDIFNQTEADNYILMQDINLYDFTPITATTSVSSLDGNGYTISIVSFANDLSNYALFETIDSTTLIKNVKINTYNLGLVNVDSTKVDQVNFAPMAITNNGNITNCEVVNFFNKTNIGVKQQTSGILLSSDIAKNVEAKTAGFVLTNNGNITNSRVGDDDGETYTIYKTDRTSGDVRTIQYSRASGTLPEFTINSFGDIAGFVYQNNGHITSSFASNIRIINNSDVDYTTITSGFVVENLGEIEMSYAKGVKTKSSDIHATLYGIETSGIASGFVYLNEGEISDCYSNINLTNKQNNPGRSSAGFVYQNTQTGTIDNALSLSRIINSTTTQMNFSGVDELGNYLSSGSITNCYYYDQVAVENNTTQIQSAYGESASSISSAIIQDYFYGFNFTNSSENDGIWKMTSVGPDLVSANSIAVSLRYVSEKSETLSTPKTTYANGYEYGSKNNPILIKSAKEYNEAFAGNTGKSVDRFVNLANNTITGSYRLISDIDLHDLATETGVYSLNSSTKTLYGNGGDKLSSYIGKFDGNGFSIQNLSLTNSADNEVTNFGMFAKLENGAMIINLNIVLGDQNTEKEIFGIEAKNVKYVGTVAGLMEDSKIVGVNVNALQNVDNVTVRGRNAVGGIVGVLRGKSNIVNSKTQNINVTAVYYPDSLGVGQTNYANYNKYGRFAENSGVSYAGGIVGIADFYTSETKDSEKFEDKFAITSSALVVVKNVGCSIIEGGTVGGIAGYVGVLTTMQDVQYMPYSKSVSDYAKQGLYSYNGFAGGIAGVCKGYLRQVRSEYDNVNIFETDDNNQSGLTLSKLIELNSLSYYNTESGNDQANYNAYTYELGNKEIFQKSGYNPLAIGGLVGLQLSGKIEKSYSKLNVTSNTAKIAGGIIGVNDYITNDSERTSIGEVYTTGDVFAKEIVSGIVGVEKNEKTGNDTTTKTANYNKVNALNFWSMILFDKEYNPKKYAIANTMEVITSSSYEIVIDKVTGIEKQTSQWTRLTESTKTEAEEKYSLGYDYGAYYDKIFTANSWDTNFWQRDNDELYPHMVFGYFDRTIKIRTQADIEKLRTNSDGTNGKVTYILDPIDDGNNIYETNRRLITVDKYIVPIVGFSSILSGGEDPTIEYGFYFEKSSRPLFESAINGAVFKDLSVYFASDISQVTVMSQTSSFVKNASNTYFTNVSFNDITLDLTTKGSVRAGIVCAVATENCQFTNVKINDCTIIIEDSSEAYVGAVFGEGSLNKDSLIEVELKHITIKGTSINGGEKSSYVGLAMGYVSTFGTISITVADENDQTRVSSLKFDKVSNAELGLLVGHIEATSSISKLSFTSKNEFSANVDIDVIENNSKVGGLFGYAKNVNIDTISFTPNINICTNNDTNSETNNDENNEQTSTFTDSVFGGVVGFAQDCTLQNISLGSFEKKSGIIVNKGIITIGNVENSNYIGSFVGIIQGNSSISNIVSYASIDISLKNDGNNNTSSEETLYVGGVAGKMDSVKMDEVSTNDTAKENNIRAYGDIYVRFNEKQSGYDLAVGGVAGTIVNTTLQNCYTSGSIMLVVPTEMENNNVNIYISGIVGYVKDEGGKGQTTQSSTDDETKYTQSIIKNCISAGNVYPTYQKDGTKSLEYANLISNSKKSYIYTTFNYGGLVGKTNAGVLTLTDNVSINTLFNKLDNGLTVELGNYNANAIIGSGELKEQSNNNYSNVYTLTIDTIGTNHKFGDEEISSALAKLRQFDTNSRKDDDEQEYFISGTKINPSTTVSTIDTIESQYIYLDSNITYENQAIKKLKNSVVISDGAEFTFNGSLSGDSIAPFGTIDENSIVAGVVISIALDHSSKSVAGFAKENAGIIYSCNVVGGHAQGTKDIPFRGLVQSTEYASGFVDTNSGFIKNCFTYLDVKSTYAGNSNINTSNTQIGNPDITIAGFARVNTGYITTSYVTGEISNLNSDESKYCTGKMYLFAPGYVYNCYSIARMVDKDISGKDTVNNHCSFENGKADSKTCFYDSYAAEAIFSDSNFARNIDDKVNEVLTLNYIESSKTKETDKKTEESETTEGSTTTDETQDEEISLVGDFGQVVTNSFGYKSFVGGAYEPLDYMHFYTGNGQKDAPFKIPNFGKLKQMAQISENSEKIYFQLDNDMDASYISSEINWQIENKQGNYYDISNIDLDGAKVDYSGNRANENYEISNLTSQNQGLFNTIKDSTIKNVNLKDISTSYVESITIGGKQQSYFGLLACYTEENSYILNSKLSIKLSLLNDSIEGINRTTTLGLLVGKVNGGTVSSCTVDILYTDVSSSLEISNKYNWTIGGLIGELESGKVQSAVLTGTKETAQAGDVALPAFSVQFDKDKSEDQSPQYGEDGNVVSGNFVIGGIVGKQTGGQIINTGIYCDIKAFTNDEQIGVDQILKVGGIVGESTASAKGTNSGVVMCYTDSKVNITGGNIYSFKKTYVAGISGYGGTIYQCKNEASILAQASYYYTDLSDLKREDVTKTQSGSDKVNGQWFEQEEYIKKADITFEYQNYGINYIAIQQDDGSFIIYYYTNDQNKKTDTTKSLANGASSVNEEWFDSHEWDWKRKSEVSYTKQEGEYTYYGEMVGIDEWKVYKILSNVNLENSMSSKNGFMTEDERKKDDIDENTYQQYYNCYNKPFGTSYKNYNKLLFARIQQQAYSGGIANNYTTVESCLNTSSDISGGMDSKNLHSVYEFDDSHYGTTMAWAYVGFVYYGWIFGGVSIMITASSIAYLTWDLDEYYFGGNGYIQSNENSYYISGKYSYIKPEDFINNVINTYESMLVNLFRAKDWHLPSGILVINNKNLATKEKFQEVAQNYSSEISSFTSNSQDYYASNSLEIYDIYFDSIGLPASGSEDDKKNSFSTTQVFSTITNNGTEYYKVNDNSKVSDGSRVQSASDYYGIVYKSSVMDKLTKKSNESDISGLIGNGFEKIGDDYKLSMQTKNATMKNLLKKVKIDGATNTIIIDIDYSDIEGEKPNEIYNKAVEMINTIYPKMTDKEYDTYKDKQNIDDDEELSNLLDEIKTIVKTVDSGYSYLININTSLKGVTLSLGTKNNPFVGKIVGSGIVNYRISGIEVQSLIDYGKDVTVHRLDLEYNEINISNDETSIGGVISYADGKTIIERVNVSYSVSTYSVDVRGNVNPKQNGINIGGFIGENNGTTAIANSNINTLNVDIRANSADKGTETYGVGGFVGKNKGELILQGVKITKENIYAKNSQNDIFGGAVGLSEGTLNVKSVTVGNNESSIDVESMTTQTIVGGLVGKIESGSTCSVEDTKISLKGIYAKTSNESATIYAGGLVGYDNANLDTSTFKQVYVGEKDSKIKMLVYSGISGSKFANKAYASDVIGNKSVELDSNTSAVNVTSKAFAKPTYTKYAPNYDTRGTVKIEADDVIRSKTKIIESAKTGNYLKVDLFEYGTESFNGSKNVNSYVNGKEYVPFNYQKSYLLSVIVKTSYSASGTDKRYEFSERFYRITFTGAPSQDDELDIGCSYTIEFIAYNEYITDTDIYGSYKSIAYPLQNRYHNYVPSDVKTFYKANNVDLDDINEDTEIFEECDTVTDNINSIVKASYFDSVSNKIKVNYSNVSSEINIISYKNIYIDENYALKFEISDESSDDNVIDGENLAKFYTSEPEDGNNKTKVNSYGYTLKHDYKIVTSETTNRFAFRFNIEDKEKNSYEKRYYDIVEPELEQETSSIKIYEKVINIDGNNKNYRKIYIISNQTVNDKTVECVEDVYIVSSDGVSYYMGNLQYKYSSENIDEKVSQRTGLFFPFVASEGDSTVNNFIKICDYYQNNLLSLTDVEQKNVFVITKNITSTQNIWYFDVQYGATDPEFELNSRNNSSRLHKIEIKESRTDTYTFKVTASDVDYTLTSEKGGTSYSETFQEVMQGIFIHKDNDGKEVAKYTINSASWENASGDGKYDFKSVTINYTVENATSPTEVTFTWQYKTDKDGKTDNYIVREVTVNNTTIYTAEFTKIGDISYLVGNNETYLMFGTNTTQYTIAGEYTITKTSDGNYKLTNNLTGSSKISYIIIDKDGNVLEIVYKQLDLYVKEDYTNDNILISKYEDFSSSTTIEYTFDEYNIKTNTQTDKICHTYLVENYDTMMIYYSLNKMSDDSEIQLFSQDLVVMKRNVVQLKGSSVYVYVVDDKLSVYNGSKEIVKDKAVDKSFDIGKITLNEENDIKYITIGDMKIDISNGLVYLGTETKTVEEASTGYSITYNAIKYEEKTIFEIYQNDSGTNTLCGKIEIASKNATIGSLWALNKGEFVILCSDGKYYSLDGQYYYTGKGISKNTSLSKTYTALGGLSASFDVYDVNLTQYNKDGSYQVTINQKVIIQTSETNLEIQSGKLTVSTEFSESFANESKFELSERSQIEEKGCIVISYINLDNSADYDIYTRQTDSSDNFIDLYKNRSGTEKTKSQLETDGYIPYKYVKYEDGNVVISANIEYDKENKEYYYNLRQESTIKIDSIERQLYTNNVRDKLYRTSNDGNSTLIKTYTFTINYMYDKKPNYYDAVRVITGTDGEVVEYPYGDKTLGYNGYPTIDGLNLFDIKVSSIQNENIQIDE